MITSSKTRLAFLKRAEWATQMIGFWMKGLKARASEIRTVEKNLSTQTIWDLHKAAPQFGGLKTRCPSCCILQEPKV